MQKNHHNILSRIITVPGLQSTAPGITAAWLRGKFFAPQLSVARLDHAAEFLRLRGYSAERSNWGRTLDRNPRLALKAERLGSMRSAHQLCANSIDFPIHQNLSTTELYYLAECLNEALT